MALFKPINHTSPGHFASGVYAFVPMMCLLEVGLFIAAVVIRRRYSVEWTRHELGILVGFGILALLTLVADLPTLLRLFHLRVGSQLEAVFRYFPSGAFIASAIAWLIAFWRPEPPTTYEPPDPRKYRELASVMKDRVDVLKQVLKRFGMHLAAPLLRHGDEFLH
jgi:hypothetical protein